MPRTCQSVSRPSSSSARFPKIVHSFTNRLSPSHSPLTSHSDALSRGSLSYAPGGDIVTLSSEWRDFVESDSNALQKKKGTIFRLKKFVCMQEIFNPFVSEIFSLIHSFYLKLETAALFSFNFPRYLIDAEEA